MDNELLLSYLDSSRGYIRNDLNNLATHFLKLGFHLREVQNMKYYEAGGYSSVSEFAEAEFGIKKSNCYNYIKLCELYSQNHNSMFLDDKYKDYNYSQLVEMMSLPIDKVGLARPDMTVRQIRDLKKPVEVISSDSNDDIIYLCLRMVYTSMLSDEERRLVHLGAKSDLIASMRENHGKCYHGHGVDSLQVDFKPTTIYVDHFDYSYTSVASYLIAHCKKFRDSLDGDVSVQTSGLENNEPVQDDREDESEPSIQVSPPGTFEQIYNGSNDRPLFDELMDILKNNIKNVDKVNAIISFLNEIV